MDMLTQRPLPSFRARSDSWDAGGGGEVAKEWAQQGSS